MPSISLRFMLQFPVSLSFIPLFFASWCPPYSMGFQPCGLPSLCLHFPTFYLCQTSPVCPSKSSLPFFVLLCALRLTGMDGINGVSCPLAFRRARSTGNTSKKVKESERRLDIYDCMATMIGTIHRPKVIVSVRWLSLHSSLNCRFQKLLPPLKLSRLVVALYTWGTSPRVSHYSLWFPYTLLIPLKQSLLTSLFELP